MISFSLTAVAWLAVFALPTSGAEVHQLRLTLAPVFNGTSISSLNATLQLENTSFKANSTLISHPVSSDFTPAQNYDKGYITATDEKGALPLDIHDGDARLWTSGRETVGIITFNFMAIPRSKDFGVVARSDLRFDSGGVFGQISNFIPLPLDDGTKWNISLTWDIPKSAPAGTRFSSSFGESTTGSATGFPSEVLALSQMGVGPLKRWPDWDEDATLPGAGEKRQFAMYWIGDFAWDINQVGPRTQASYMGTSKYFNDTTGDFHVFMRQEFENQDNFGGIGGYHSFLLEYIKTSPSEYPLDQINNLLSHEMVHNFALTYPFEYYNTWYQEGMAEYLCAVGPYEGGTLDKATFLRWLNDNAQDYYTESPLTRTWDSLVDGYWYQGTNVAKAPYTRGFMYIAYANAQIAVATQHQHSIDDVILELYRLYIDGKNVATPEYLTSLSKYLGKQAAQDSFDTMANGTLLVPHPDGFLKAGLKMVRKDKYKFDLGYQEGTNITGLVKGSRAEEAGLREGDIVLHSFAPWTGSNTYNSTMEVVVDRNGTNKTITYWPRSHQLVEAWEWQTIDN